MNNERMMMRSRWGGRLTVLALLFAGAASLGAQPETKGNDRINRSIQRGLEFISSAIRHHLRWEQPVRVEVQRNGHGCSPLRCRLRPETWVDRRVRLRSPLQTRARCDVSVLRTPSRQSASCSCRDS